MCIVLCPIFYLIICSCHLAIPTCHSLSHQQTLIPFTQATSLPYHSTFLWNLIDASVLLLSLFNCITLYCSLLVKSVRFIWMCFPSPCVGCITVSDDHPLFLMVIFQANAYVRGRMKGLNGSSMSVIFGIRLVSKEYTHVSFVLP